MLTVPTILLLAFGAMLLITMGIVAVNALRLTTAAATALRSSPIMSHGSWVVSDLDGIIVAAGGRLVDMLGYYPAELIGKNVSVLIHPKDDARAQHDDGFAYVKRTGTVREKAIIGKALCANGSAVPIVIALAVGMKGPERVVKAEIFVLREGRAFGE